jgi:hypothetical protein
MTTRGFPELQEHYRAYNADTNIKHVALTQFPHNYNSVSRSAMYDFVNRHLKLGLDETIIEKPFRRLSRKELSVWDDDHSRPANNPDFEQRLLDQIRDDSQKQLAALAPRDAESLKEYRKIVGGAWDILLRNLPKKRNIRFDEKSSMERKGYSVSLGLLSYKTVDSHNAQLPVITLTPENPVGRTVIWISESGKASLFNRDGTPRTPVQRLLANGRTVIGADLIHQGEFLSQGKAVLRQRSLPGEAGYGGWTYCYNLPLFARRVHDVLAVIQFAIKSSKSAHKIDIIGLRQAGPLVAAAVAQSQRQIDRAAIHTDGFRFAQLTNVYDTHFLPGAAKYGDVPGLLSLATPTKLWLAGEPVTEDSIIGASWQASGKSDLLTIYSGRNIERDAVQWLLK